MAEFARAGVALFAISYDPVPVLEEFATRWGITYPLLSDEGRRAIRALGQLNEHTDEQVRFYGAALRDEHQGIPYSGLFLLATDGTVAERQFERSYRRRPAAALVLDELLGPSEQPPVATAQADGPGLHVAAWLDTPTYRPYQKLRLHLGLRVAPGLHVYAAPTPDGFTPLAIEIAPREGLSVWPLITPSPRSFRVAAWTRPSSCTRTPSARHYPSASMWPRAPSLWTCRYDTRPAAPLSAIRQRRWR